MKKRLLSIMLALSLVLTLLPAAAWAAMPTSGTCGDNLTWNFSGNTLTISGTGEMYSYSQAVFVQAIIPWQDFRDRITQIVIGQGVTNIGTDAFLSCHNLRNISIPNSVTSFDSGVFGECTNLKSISIPSSVTYIGSSTFFGCSNLTSVTIPNNVTSIGSNAFWGCSSLSSITIPDGITAIDVGTFDGCSNLRSVTIPKSVTSINYCAFDKCYNLKDVYYGGSESDWRNVSIDTRAGGTYNNPVNGNKALFSASIHYNSAGSDTAPTSSFTDVSAGAFYTNAVSWAVDKNITNGTGGTSFSPGRDCTHAQILTFLYRAERGGAAVSAADMDKAIGWAREKGMIGAGFNSSAKCTRADAVNYIWQAFGRQSAAASSFGDVSSGANYAAAVSWAVANGITDGTGGGNFSPDKVCNRGTIVTFLHRAYVPGARLTIK